MVNSLYFGLVLCYAVGMKILTYRVRIEPDEGGRGYIAYFPALPGCHTQAKTMDQLIERTKEAIRAYLGENKNPKISEQFVGVQQIEV